MSDSGSQDIEVFSSLKPSSGHEKVVRPRPPRKKRRTAHIDWIDNGMVGPRCVVAVVGSLSGRWSLEFPLENEHAAVLRDWYEKSLALVEGSTPAPEAPLDDQLVLQGFIVVESYRLFRDPDKLDEILQVADDGLAKAMKHLLRRKQKSKVTATPSTTL